MISKRIDMKSFDILVLGGGASGSICAIRAKSLNPNKSIAIIDNQNRIAKKLLVTGNGKCNITFEKMIDKAYNQNIDAFFNRFSNFDLLDYFKKLGLLCFCEEGRYYPLSNSAKSVVEIIENAIDNLGIPLFLEHEIFSISKKDEKFVVVTSKEIFECNTLVYALGKSDKLLENFDFDCKKCFPSLMALKTKENLKNLQNIKVSNVKVTAHLDSGESDTEQGEVLFKEHGLSGVCIFNLSTLFARNQVKNGSISIDLMPYYSKQTLKKLLAERKNTLNVTIKHFFDGIMVRPLNYYLLNKLKLQEDRPCFTLTNSEISNMAFIIKNLTFSVCDFYENNQVFSGGIELDNLDGNLQSKKYDNLYIIGESLNVDGKCGGFNLQWAWTNGFIVGSKI